MIDPPISEETRLVDECGVDFSYKIHQFNPRTHIPTLPNIQRQINCMISGLIFHFLNLICE
jgi:hypothetical protein